MFLVVLEFITLIYGIPVDFFASWNRYMHVIFKREPTENFELKTYTILALRLSKEVNQVTDWM